MELDLELELVLELDPESDFEVDDEEESESEFEVPLEPESEELLSLVFSVLEPLSEEEACSELWFLARSVPEEERLSVA